MLLDVLVSRILAARTGKVPLLFQTKLLLLLLPLGEGQGQGEGDGLGEGEERGSDTHGWPPALADVRVRDGHSARAHINPRAPAVLDRHVKHDGVRSAVNEKARACTSGDAARDEGEGAPVDDGDASARAGAVAEVALDDLDGKRETQVDGRAALEEG